jgi:hypothetical protein
MKAEELRFGNYLIEIDHNEEEELTKVFGVIMGVINPLVNEDYNGGAFGQKKYYQGCKYKPIPLTEDWLLKLGFEEMNLHLNWKKRNHQMILNDGVFRIWLNGYNKEIKYVHQLQNLYYALTGEELTINEI